MAFDVDVSRLVGLEGLGRRRLGRGLGQLVNTSTHQQSVQGRPAHRRVDEFAHHRKQVVQRQAQLLAQVDDQLLLVGVQRGLQLVRGVAAVFHRVAVLPALNARAADAVLRSQFAFGGRRLLDLRPHRGRGRGVLVQCDHHAAWLPETNAAMTALRTSRPKSRPRLLCRSQLSGTRQLTLLLFNLKLNTDRRAHKFICNLILFCSNHCLYIQRSLYLFSNIIYYEVKCLQPHRLKA